MPKTPLIAATLPQQKGEVWQGGWFQTPFWIRRGHDQASRPWLPLWVSTRGPFAMPGGLQESKGRDEDVASLFDATLEELQRRPERIEVLDEGIAKILRKRLGSSEIEIRKREELEQVADLLSQMAADFGVPDFPGALEVRGVTVDAMRRYAEAARDFYRSAPWRHLSDRDLLEILAGAPPGFRYAVVLGNGRGVKGLGFFDDKPSFWKLSSGDAPSSRAVRNLWSLTFGSIAELPMSEADLWVDHALPLAGPDAYPLAACFQSADRVKRPSPRVLEFLTGLLAALSTSAPEELDRGRWTRVVETEEGGERSYELSLPLLLEPPTPRELMQRGIFPDPRAFGRAFLSLHQAASKYSDRSPSELARKLRDEISGPVDEIFEPANDRERAHEICFAAFDAWGRRKIQLVEQALALDPDCVDALVLKAEHTAELDEAVALYQRAVAAGEARLEAESIEEVEGDLWGWFPARPYLRALHGLGHALQDREDLNGAISCLQRLLELDQTDHQDIRHCLLSCLLDAGQFRDAEAHIKAHRASDESFWDYAKALAAFGRHGDGKRSRKALYQAFGENPFAGVALLDLDVPSDSDFTDDALDCSQHLAASWERVPGAYDWLARELDMFMRS